MYVAMYHQRMARMIRKQVYIDPRQERLLKRRARELRVTEAELIRQGIDLLAAAPLRAVTRERAIREYEAVVRERMAMTVPQTGRAWTREELYEERFARWPR